jgi:hypothetical protein
MLNQADQGRLYQFSHDVGRPSWEIETTAFMLNVSYPNASESMTEAVAGENVILRNIHDGISVEHRFYPYTVATVATYQSIGGPLSISLNFSSPVGITEHSDGMLVVSDSSGNELISFVPSRPRDDTGMMGPVPTVSLSEEGDDHIIELSVDPEWMNDTSRVFPVTLPIDYSLTPLSDSMRSVGLMAIADQTVLYRDTRPDSATQFQVMFFDDYEFRRPRPMFDGKPTCSTVPTVLPSTVVTAASQQINITTEDAERYEDGNGYDSRTVWLRFIASKSISSNTSVYYDVDTPGTSDLEGNVAERIGEMDGLPIYRGSFDVNRANPPGSQDGIGRLTVYIGESREKEISVRMTIAGIRTSSLNARANVLYGKAGVSPLAGRIEVMSFAKLYSTMDVVGSSGVDTQTAKLDVIQTSPALSITTDPEFRVSDEFSTQWDTPVTYTSPGYMISPTTYESGEMSWQSDGVVVSEPYTLTYLDMFAVEQLERIPGAMEGLTVPISDTRIVNGLVIEIVNRVDPLSADSGYEWVNQSSSLPILDITVSGLGAGAGELDLSIGSTTTPWTSDVWDHDARTRTNTYVIAAADLAADDAGTVNISYIRYVSGIDTAYRRLVAHPFTQSTAIYDTSTWKLNKLSVSALTS